MLELAPRREEKTEGHFSAGVHALLAGQTDKATDHFAWVRDNGVKEFIEYDLALTELARLGAGG